MNEDGTDDTRDPLAPFALAHLDAADEYARAAARHDRAARRTNIMSWMLGGATGINLGVALANLFRPG